MFESKGTVRYGKLLDYRVVVDISKELSSYYYSFIPKYYRLHKPGWSPHITVVRPEIETPVNIHLWEKHEGKVIDFYYTNKIDNDRGFYWIFAWSKQLEEIRTELGLINSWSIVPTPEGFSKNFHITIAKSEKTE